MKNFKWQALIPLTLGAVLVAVLLNQSQFGKMGSAIANSQHRSSDEVKVVKVSDGDTVKLEDGRSIRLCGVDAPEKAQPQGKEARAYLEKLVQRAKGEAYLEAMEADKYGRTVGEITLRIADSPSGELNVNSEMVLSGHAFFYKQFSKCPNADRFEAAEEIAMTQRLGVHASPGFEKPWDYRKRIKSAS